MVVEEIMTGRGQLVLVDKAIESMRDSGFDLATAAGEPVDNSIEGNASQIRIRTVISEDAPAGEDRGRGRRPKPVKSVNAIAFADNGIGISPEILPNVLTLGFSTRYNERNGLGRFGVGMKLAAISQAQRVDLYTRPLGSDTVYHVYLDLEEIKDGTQQFLLAETVDGFPGEFVDLMHDSKTGVPHSSGTLVVWSKVDRLTEGGKYGSSLDQRLAGLLQFLARAYRKFIDQGLYIELNDKPVMLHDPLFLLYNPRVKDQLGKDVRGRIVEHEIIEIDGHEVGMTVTLYPEDVRRRRFAGGRGDRVEEFRDLHIPENEGKISILRQGREIYYDIVPKLLPGGKDEVDRFIGIEISFPAALDEYFQVRNVKRGAEPVDKLRERIRSFLVKPVRAARKDIRALWDETDAAERSTTEEHEAAEEAVSRAEQTSPRGKAGANISQEKLQEIMQELVEDLGAADDPQRAQEIRERVNQLPITVYDVAWPGNALVDIQHLNNKAIVKMNQRHPFIREIYDPIRQLAASDVTEVTPAEAIRMARRVEIALDVLFMAYAKAESMHPDPDAMYGDLRSYWGQFVQAYVREALQEEARVNAA